MNRYYLLTLALQYDSYGEKYLTDFDRMFIHQEISAILNKNSYVVPEETERKLQPKLEYIIKTNWECPF